MRKHLLRRWLTALLVAPLLALAVSASSFSGLRCTMSGLFLPDVFLPDTGCAMAGDGAQSPDGAPNATLEEPACCERVVVAHDKAPAAASARPEIAPPSVHLLSAAILQPPPRSIPRTPRRERASAPHGGASPVFLLTQSFLI